MNQFITKYSSVNILSKALYKACAALIRDFNEMHTLSNLKRNNFAKISISRAKNKIKDFICLSVENEKWEMQISGIHNFISGIPFFSMSAKLYRENEITVVTIDPFHNEIFWAVEEQGAYFRHAKAQVSSQNSIERGTLIIPSPHINVNKVIKQIRCLGNTELGLAYLSIGRVDGILVEGEVMSNLLATESGAVSTKITLHQKEYTLFSNQFLLKHYADMF